jgi:hypothetical protein
MTLDHIVATMTLDTIVAFDIIVAFVIPVVALLTSSPVMWRKNTFRILVHSMEYTFPILYATSLRMTMIEI